MLDRDQLIRLIRALYDDMKNLTVQSGIVEAKYLAILEIAEDLETELQQLMELHTWLTELRTGAYDLVLKVWERHKPETWKMYEVMEVYGLPEQVLLRKYQRELREAWKGMPHVKRKKRSRKAANAEGSSEGSNELCVQSETEPHDEDHRRNR